MSAETLTAKSPSILAVELIVSLTAVGILAEFIDDMFDNNGSKTLISELLPMILKEAFSVADLNSLAEFEVNPNELSDVTAKYYKLICDEPEQSSDSEPDTVPIL